MFLLEGGGTLQIGQTLFLSSGPAPDEPISFKVSQDNRKCMLDNPIQTAPAAPGHGGEQNPHTHSQVLSVLLVRWDTWSRRTK